VIAEVLVVILIKLMFYLLNGINFVNDYEVKLYLFIEYILSS